MFNSQNSQAIKTSKRRFGKRDELQVHLVADFDRLFWLLNLRISQMSLVILNNADAVVQCAFLFQ